MTDSKYISSGDLADNEFFTTEQVAQILEMTPRTIRNFIKSKKIRAAKFGGEWRISKADLIEFMERHFDSQNGDRRYEEMNNTVHEFIDGDHMEIEGPLQICTIIDLYSDDKELAIRKRDEIFNIVNTESAGNFKSQWYYDEGEKKSRMILWSDNPLFTGKLFTPLANLKEK